ncbi:MAG: hypothetical protein CMN39_07330 [SAR116 cluster bacterium]|nr:hypothetical protein [SAR116 cluster bacterium]
MMRTRAHTDSIARPVAGHALENHLEAIFLAREIKHSRGAETEHRNKPDFLFPSIEDYRDPSFAPSGLTMLAAKSTLKDRWRQVLTEAARIDHKHLLTLEPAVSEQQTEQMKAENLQLVVPGPFHHTYTRDQQNWLMDFKSFIELTRIQEARTT